MKLFSVMLSVCTFALLQGAAVHGESLTHWQSIIDPLLHAGIVKIGTFDVEGFRTDASQTVVSHISEAPPSVLSGSRQSA
ncbi:MAG: hypothetical protein ACXVA9_04315, partial [Bdellovibrionales bacterium]